MAVLWLCCHLLTVPYPYIFFVDSFTLFTKPPIVFLNLGHYLTELKQYLCLDIFNFWDLETRLNYS